TNRTTPRTPPMTRPARCRNDRILRRPRTRNDVRVADAVPAHRLPGRLRARRLRPAVRLPRHGGRIVVAEHLPGAAAARVRHRPERHPARDSLLHADGPDPRAQRHGRRPARHRRPGVRADPRWPRAGGDLRRRAARSDHRCGRGLGDLDGPDLAADHAALRLQSGHRKRRDYGLRHAGADRTALAGADRDRRPARSQRRRLVQRGLHPRLRADRHVRAVHRRSGDLQAGLGPGLAPGAGPYRGPDGRPGMRSLGVFGLFVTIIAVTFGLYYGEIMSALGGTEVKPALDETIVVALTGGTLFAFFAAV